MDIRIEQLKDIYRSFSPEGQSFQVKEIANSASNRRYFRFSTNESSHIGTIGEQEEENRAFVYFSRHLWEKQLPVPKVLACSPDASLYIQEDLGSLSLFDHLNHAIESTTFTDEEVVLLEKTVQCLARFQHEGVKGLDTDYCYPRASFDERSVKWDLNYFKYCFLKPLLPSLLEDRLEDEFDRLLVSLLSFPTDVLVHRDFQTRNVIVRDGEPYFIDFQGGRVGAMYYDLASFIFQPRAKLPLWVRERLTDAYIKEVSENYKPIDRTSFATGLNQFGLFRLLQLLGAYGYRGLYEGKSRFVTPILPCLHEILALMEGVGIELPYMKSLFTELMVQFENNPLVQPCPPDKLTVDLYSFSYKKKIPADYSGNGGGFVFDCRAIHNPARYESLRSLTGRDPEVIAFFEQREDIHTFLESVFQLAFASVERYLERGFTHLQFSFGCTGGQHRSVYCAERLTKALREKYPVLIHLNHIEQGISETHYR